MEIPVNGRKRLAFLTACVPYSQLSVIERIQKKTGQSRSKIIADCIERALGEICDEVNVKVPKALPTDRRSYLTTKGLGL